MQGNWRDRISKMETAPPPGAWENIAERLETDQYKFRDKIYHQEATAPADIWQRITNELDGMQDIKKVVPISKYYSWIAVAAVFVIVAGSLVFINKQTPASSRVASNNTVTKKQAAIPTTDNQPAPVISPSTPDLTASNTNNNEPARTIVSNNTSNVSRILHRNIVTTALNTVNRNMAESMAVNGNHYITVCGPQNQPVKVSAKFQPVLGYLNNHSYVDDILNGCEEWKQKVCEWRDKMLNAPVISSGDNFLDIIDFAKTISDDNK
jgi:hypothetical protein